jgi:HK97 gp10 family phage protein
MAFRDASGRFVSYKSKNVTFDDRLPGIVEELVTETDDDAIAVANDVARDARRLAPKLAHAIVYPSFVRMPGWLAESIEATQVPGGGAAIRVGAYWGIFQEFGSENMHAQPYLEPAAELHEVELERRVRSTLSRL